MASRPAALSAVRTDRGVRTNASSWLPRLEARAIAPVTAVQNEFHATQRGDADLLAVCDESGIAFVPFFPLGGRGQFNDERLAKVAAQHGATVTQVGLAWLLTSSPVTLAIPGTGSLSHLEDNMAAARITLTEEDLA
jgi:aryl-alcohol dehydrogenase-like predicted oxidoreductase